MSHKLLFQVCPCCPPPQSPRTLVIGVPANPAAGRLYHRVTHFLEEWKYTLTRKACYGDTCPQKDANLNTCTWSGISPQPAVLFTQPRPVPTWPTHPLPTATPGCSCSQRSLSLEETEIIEPLFSAPQSFNLFITLRQVNQDAVPMAKFEQSLSFDTLTGQFTLERVTNGCSAFHTSASLREEKPAEREWQRVRKWKLLWELCTPQGI